MKSKTIAQHEKDCYHFKPKTIKRLREFASWCAVLAFLTIVGYGDYIILISFDTWEYGWYSLVPLIITLLELFGSQLIISLIIQLVISGELK